METKRENVAISYEISGNGTTTLFFVHGAFINKAYWNAQVEYFSKDFKVVTIDLPGHGTSGKNRQDWTIEEFGKDVTAVIEKTGLDNIILIGHSLSGDVILEAAVQIPEKVIGIIGIDTLKQAGVAMSDEIARQSKEILDNFKVNFSDAAENYVRMLLVSESTSKEITDRVISDYIKTDPQLGAQLMESVFQYWKRERELLQQLTLKVNLINCDYLPTSEEPLKDYVFSGFEMRDIHASSHFPMIEKPEELNHMIESMVNNIVMDHVSAVKLKNSSTVI